MAWIGILAAAAVSHQAPTASPTQPPPPATPSQQTQASQPAEGVIVYQPDYFADARPNTALDMIRRLPGFLFSGGDQVRGFAGAGGNVLIDGQRPASKTDALADVVNRIPASDVERIEVVRGGSGGIDMQGHTVVANIIRRKGAKTQGVLAASVNMFPDDKAAWAVRAEGSRRWNGRTLEGALLAYTSIFNGDGADGYRTRRDANGGLLFESRVEGHGEDQGVQLRGGFSTPMMGGDLRLNASLSSESPRVTEETFFLNTQTADLVTFEQPQIRGETGLNYKRPLTERLATELILLQRLNKWQLESTNRSGPNLGLFTEDAMSGESIARGILRFRKSENLTFEGGAEAAYNFLDSTTAFTQNGVPIALPNASVLVQERRGEAFAQASWRVSPKLTVEAGSRFEVSTISQSGDTDLEKSFFYPKPRAVVTWSPNKETQLRLRVERSVGQLNFGDFVASSAFSTDDVEAGNADLEPSKVWVYEAALERRFWGTGAIVMTVGHQEITDALDRIPIRVDTDGDGDIDQVFDAVGNIGDATVDLLRLDITIPTDKLFIPRGQLKLYASWADVHVTDPTTGEIRRASGNAPFVGEIHFTQDLPLAKSTWGFDYVSPIESASYRFNEIRRNGNDAYLSAFWEVKPTPVWAVRMEAQNLLRRSLRRDREVYSGTRDVAPLLFHEVRDVDFAPFFYVRVRRTFG